jgi:flagellar biogenesis protein FliO
MLEASLFDVVARMLPPLVLIVGCLLLLRRWAQRGGSTSSPGVRVVARTGLTRSAVVGVVEVAGRRFLVGGGEAGVTLLAELPADEWPHPDPSPPPAPAVTDVALSARTAFPHDRPWMGPISRLRALTVRTHLRGPINVPPPA